MGLKGNPFFVSANFMRRKEKTMKKEHVVGWVCLVTLLMLTGAAQAQEKYPDRDIQLVIPMGPGGSTDQLGRVYADQLAKELKVSISSVNREGGTGIQGTAFVIKAKKDGYTLLVGSVPALVFQPVVSNEVPYDPFKDLTPLGQMATVPLVIAVRSDSPIKTLDELVEYARKNPGKLKNSVGGLLTDSHFMMEVLGYNKNIKITTVPFKSGAESMAALLGGHVDMAADTLTSLRSQITAGKFRALSISSKTRHPDFPNIPTTAELGYPALDLVAWWGLFVATGVPQTALNVLVPALEKASQNPDVVQRVTRLGFTSEYKTPEEFRKMMMAETRMVEKVAAEANLIKK
jgi:tripartite-type tricarboxylate transporter receptor subunit TctC